MAFHWALSWKCSQLCILPFYFFHFLLARSMCVCLVVIGFVMFCPFSGLVGWLCQMAFHWALSWKRSQPCILPFYFFHLLFRKKHVFCFVGCGLWDSAWQMANLPDRSKCISYRKILWFWNAMIYLHYCACDP